MDKLILQVLLSGVGSYAGKKTAQALNDKNNEMAYTIMGSIVGNLIFYGIQRNQPKQLT
jgi:uncharacterized membrane protein YeaQ/YmgE (transglycosylase-associated protein family)